jgi:hypothetical protein
LLLEEDCEETVRRAFQDRLQPGYHKRTGTAYDENNDVDDFDGRIEITDIRLRCVRMDRLTSLIAIGIVCILLQNYYLNLQLTPDFG